MIEGLLAPLIPKPACHSICPQTAVQVEATPAGTEASHRLPPKELQQSRAQNHMRPLSTCHRLHFRHHILCLGVRRANLSAVGGAGSLWRPCDRSCPGTREPGWLCPWAEAERAGPGGHGERWTSLGGLRASRRRVSVSGELIVFEGPGCINTFREQHCRSQVLTCRFSSCCHGN